MVVYVFSFAKIERRKSFPERTEANEINGIYVVDGSLIAHLSHPFRDKPRECCENFHFVFAGFASAVSRPRKDPIFPHWTCACLTNCFGCPFSRMNSVNFTFSWRFFWRFSSEHITLQHSIAWLRQVITIFGCSTARMNRHVFIAWRIQCWLLQKTVLSWLVVNVLCHTQCSPTDSTLCVVYLTWHMHTHIPTHAHTYTMTHELIHLTRMPVVSSSHRQFNIHSRPIVLLSWERQVASGRVCQRESMRLIQIKWILCRQRS